MSSASLLAGQGLTEPVVSSASLLVPRSLGGAGSVLRLVVGLAKQHLARFIVLFVGGPNLRHPHAVLPAF